jgi:hypothetical protein
MRRSDRSNRIVRVVTRDAHGVDRKSVRTCLICDHIAINRIAAIGAEERLEGCWSIAVIMSGSPQISFVI